MVQFRLLGGTGDASVTAVVADSWIKTASLSLLPLNEVDVTFEPVATIEILPDALEYEIRGLFVKGLKTQMLIRLRSICSSLFVVYVAEATNRGPLK